MKWNLDITHSQAEFAVKHLMISTVRGRFKTLEGSGETNPDGTLKQVELRIDVSSIDTNNTQRDDHLRSADFFDAAKLPKLTFTSTKIDQAGGDVTITGDLNRTDWGLGWNMALEAGGFVVSEKVKLSIEVEAVAVAVETPVAA